MFNKIKSRIFSSHHNPSNNRTDMASSYTSVEVSRHIHEADKAKFQLSKFMGSVEKGTEFVSLGENCSSAWYLKQLGLKEGSYPFDWIFSSPDIVLDCINDKFEKYLDKELISPKDDQVSAGHFYYHSNLFNHRNPLASEDDYNYFKRCCNRFFELVNSQDHSCYLITLINEPSKRPGWAKGFTNQFHMPKDQSIETVSSLIENIKERNINSKFVIIDHYTNSNRPTISKKINDSVFLVEFYAGGESTGVFYKNQLDDFCFKLVLTGLYGISKNT